MKRTWVSRWTPAILVLLVVAGWSLFKKPTNRPTFQLDGDILVSGNPNLREVNLTFDDGPHPGSMNKILDVLKEENVRATFFVVGKIVDKHPELVRRMMAEGHEVGNHTYTHKRLTQMPLKSARQEIAACAASVKRATGADMTLLRPPGMGYNNSILHLAQDMGYVTIHWNVVAADYVRVDPRKVYERVMRQTGDGSVILLHDSPDTADALKDIIRSLRAKKFRFVTTTQMLARLPRPVLVPSNAYAVRDEPADTAPVVRPTIRKKVAINKPKAIVQPLDHRKARKTGIDTPTGDGAPTLVPDDQQQIDGHFEEVG